MVYRDDSANPIRELLTSNPTALWSTVADVAPLVAPVPIPAVAAFAAPALNGQLLKEFEES